MLNDENKRIAPDYRIVAIDETQYWNLETLPEVEKCLGIYLVNFNELTYCCELTPSYWLVPIAQDYTLKEGLEISDERREKIMDLFQDNIRLEGLYMHCSDVKQMENLPMEADPDDVADYLEGIVDELSGIEDDIIERVYCNSLYYALVK